MFNIIFQIFTFVLRIVGIWLLFEKCKVKRIWAIVPVANSYKIAECADEEDSGAVWCLSSFIVAGLYFTDTLFKNLNHDKSTFYSVILILEIVFVLINFIYSIRVYSGLCSTFGKKKKWVVLWIVAESFVMFYWGISKKIQPIHAEDLKEADESGKTAEKLDEGLTININKRTARKGLFRKKTMLKDIHFNIAPGKMVLLLGGSGAGKTTFINAVTGYEKADATIVLNGSDVYKDFEKVIYDIGVVPQQDLIRNTDTVYRTLMDAAALRMPSNIKPKQRKERVEEVMEIFGLSALKNNIIGKQSGGQKKRISIATEYISDPSLFILDEPDSGLDGILAKELMQKLHEISREGKIVIVVTHTPDRVIDLFDEVIVLAKDESRTGRLVYKGPVEDAKKFFEADSMEAIVRTINRPDEGGLGRADELVKKFNEMSASAEVVCNE